MTGVAGILAGARITAAMIAAIAPNAVVKGDDESLSSSTAMQNDDALVIPLTANSSWLVVCFFNYVATTGADFKYRFTAPSGITGYQQPTRLNLSGQFTGAFSSLWTDTVTADGQGASTIMNVFAFGQITTGPAGGDLQLQWAQNTSNGNSTTVKAGSILAAWQVA
jgi:hypothetical protein